MNDETWRDTSLRTFCMLIDGRARSTIGPEPESNATLLIIFNGHHEKAEVTLPSAIKGSGWRLELDSSESIEKGHTFKSAEKITVNDRSLWFLSMV